MYKKLTFKELVELVNKICNSKLSDEEVRNVPHPAPSDLIFWHDEDLSPKEAAEIALAYKEEK